VVSIQSHQCDFIELQNTRFPFDDRNVRAAASLGIDRTELLNVIMDGQGAVAQGLFPEGSGADVAVIQTSDVDQARQLLDQSGWTMGPDGVRTKNGQKLAFSLLSQPQQPEMTPLAVAIQGQLKPLGDATTTPS
jgi:peptide/nickel transport system substrate-binding protein